MKKKNNYSLERVLSPTWLDSNLPRKNLAPGQVDEQGLSSSQFLNSFSGHRAMLKLLQAFQTAISEYGSRIENLDKTSELYQKEKAFLEAQSDLLDELNDQLSVTMRSLLCLDYNDAEIPPADNSDLGIKVDSLILNPNALKPVDVQHRDEIMKQLVPASEPGFFDKIKSVFGNAVDALRGYSDTEKLNSKADIDFYNYLQAKNAAQDTDAAVNKKAILNKAESTPLAFSNNGVRNMKLRKSARKTFSNEQACDMLANKLTKDWFVCEPECKPIIAEQLKMAKVPAATFAPALMCNRLQYDGEAPVSNCELAALDRVQMFIQALKDEIARGNDCGGIKMVPEEKVFALKRILKHHLRNFADASSEFGTPPEIIEAVQAGIEVDAPEKYEAVAEAAEAGQISPEVAGAPALVAPTAMDPAAMGRVYDDVIDSTIADDSGIVQDDMSGYDAAPGELSLSAAEIGDEMAQAQANAIIVGDDAAAPAPIQPVMAPAAPQNFSRSVRRQQMQKNAKRQNFAARPVRQPVQQVQRVSIKGLRGLLGDKYVK